MERLIKKIKIGPLVLELCGLEYCAWYPSPSSSGTILYWPLILYEHHSLLSQFSETQLTHIPTATLSSLTFSISLSTLSDFLNLAIKLSHMLSISLSVSLSLSFSVSLSLCYSVSLSLCCSVSLSLCCSCSWSPSHKVCLAQLASSV